MGSFILFSYYVLFLPHHFPSPMDHEVTYSMCLMDNAYCSLKETQREKKSDRVRGRETGRALLIIPYTEDSATLGSSLGEFSTQANIYFYINNMVWLLIIIWWCVSINSLHGVWHHHYATVDGPMLLFYTLLNVYGALYKYRICKIIYKCNQKVLQSYINSINRNE